jgi:hypothetical protein
VYTDWIFPASAFLAASVDDRGGGIPIPIGVLIMGALSVALLRVERK